MSKEKKILPELRFPEFANVGDWQEKPLDKLANRVLDKNRDSAITSVFTNSAVHGIVDQRDFFDKDIANKSNLGNYYIVEDGDYVYNPRISNEAPVGPISKNNTGRIGVMSPLYTVFRFKNNENQFYEYYFISQHWYTAIRKASNTGARFDRMSITDSVFMGIPVLFPSPQEQQKIASCLSSLDELLEAHNDKLDALKYHKKGLMQNLFPQEGETVPKVRFKEFENDGEWIKDELNNLCFNISSGKDKNQDNGIFDLYGSTGIIGKTENASFDGDYILVARVGANAGLLNRAVGQFGVTDNTLVVNLKEPDKIDFIFYSLDRIGLNKLVFGSGQPLVTGKQLKELNIPFPTNPKEQQKIAFCLSALDELINAQAEKIEQLQQHKKGLMQGLFPKIES